MTIVTLTMNPAVDVFASVPKVAPKLKLRCSGARRDPGGGGINVARVAARMGADVRAIFPAGGPNGETLCRLVKAEVRECEIVSISEETRENCNIREEATGEQYRFIFPGPRLSVAERDACRRCVSSLRPAPEYFVISGGLPGAVDPDFIASVINDVKHMESRVIVDAAGPALAAALDAGVFLAKPNLSELEDYLGTSLRSRAEIFSACQTLVAAGKVEAVALTMGAKGAMLVTRDAVLEAPALQVAKQSEIGAGDSFLGALVWALDSRHDLEAAFRFAMAAGAAALLAPGTQLSRRGDVEQLVQDVTVLTQSLGNPSAI